MTVILQIQLTSIDVAGFGKFFVSQISSDARNWWLFPALVRAKVGGQISADTLRCTGAPEYTLTEPTARIMRSHVLLD